MRKGNTGGFGESMKKTILGVKIDDVSLDQAIKIVYGWLEKPGKHYIVTINPEFLMTAQQDNIFKEILKKADLGIPDGVGLKLSGDIVCNTPGIDLMESLIKLAEEKGFTIGLLGGRGGVANKTADCLKKKYPKLTVSFISEEPAVIHNTDILFVAFGHPKQEYWIAENLEKIPVKVAMGVGGAFDYLSGKVRRAPIWVRSMELEWLFRLIIQPWRIKRQLALFKFFVLIWIYGRYKNTQRS